MHALIIGGGIAGPATALALRKAGIQSTVFEAYPGAAEGTGGVLSIAPNGLDALRTIDVGEAALAVGQSLPDLVIGDGRGKQFGEFTGPPEFPPNLVMWRHQLHGVLHGHAKAQGIQILHGKQLAGVTESPGGITARFRDGSTAQGDLLIGADGIRSTVRTLIDADAPVPQYTGYLGFCGHASGSEVVPRPGAMHFVFGKRTLMGYWTAPDARVMWFCNLPHQKPLTIGEARDIPAVGWLRAVQELVADDIPARALLDHTRPDDLLLAGAGEILPSVTRWHRGRMVLVGDAAHAPSSSSGQGASLSLESAVQLARCLRDLPDATNAFAAYEALRRSRVEKVAAEAARRNNAKASGPVARAVTSLLLPIVMKTFLKPEKMFGAFHGHRIDWNEVVSQPGPGAAS